MTAAAGTIAWVAARAGIDLPAAFYRLILDESMAHSCGYWPGPDGGLASAQAAKLDMVCRKLGLRPGSRLLDLGCGWGSLTVHAARHCQARVTGITLSAEQGGFIRGRLDALGLGDLAGVRVQDYRDAGGGPYDAIASIEMGEHVGAAGYPAFCAALRDLVRPGGRVLIQQMSRGRRTPGGGAFIESYIAADMHMRPVGETVSLLESAGLEVLGDERARLWRLYLAGGALAFEEGRMGVDQILAARHS
ncbi:MAG TPA: cyclopropane-fatty-acyl-phospholipid synthase family protein [Trebonia sp.]|nr:cyclopropane-fatty-acyl-phospholipid synthase family protein [Trebonia sp.]